MLHGILLAAVLLGLVVLLLLLVNLVTTPRLSRVRFGGHRISRVSILIPARNEEENIERAVRSQLSQDYPDFEVLVVNDRSTDATGKILAELEREDPRLRVIQGTDPPVGWLGKPHALHLAAAAATGGLLLFVDADVIYDARCLAEAVHFVEARGLDFLALLPRIEAEGFWEDVLMPYILSAFFLGPGFLGNCDWPRWLAVGGGSGNLIRRFVYDSIGGHETLKDSVIDDLHLALRTKRAGFRVRVVRAEDRVSVRMYRGLQEIWEGFTKNMAYGFNGALGAFLLLVTALSWICALLPAGVLLFALFRGTVAHENLLLAGLAFSLGALARAVLAAALGDPLWPCVTHPIMSAVWAGIICRSFYHRVIQRRLTWRGREFDARAARF